MEDSKNLPLMLLFLSGAVMVLVGLDLISDYASGSTLRHLFLEAVLLVVSGAFFVLAVRRLLLANREIVSLRGDVAELGLEKERWREENRQLLAGLSVKIENQFAHWKLTQAEMEVGFLLLKGFSLKEIADVRNTQVKTVQQQSQSIYQKTGLASRAQLAAFFLEDLLPPGEPDA